MKFKIKSIETILKENPDLRYHKRCLMTEDQIADINPIGGIFKAKLNHVYTYYLGREIISDTRDHYVLDAVADYIESVEE